MKYQCILKIKYQANLWYWMRAALLPNSCLACQINFLLCFSSFQIHFSRTGKQNHFIAFWGTGITIPFSFFKISFLDKSAIGYRSCKDAFEQGLTIDGVYNLDNGLHYCAMSDTSICGGGGWTLALKIDGSKVKRHFSHNYSAAVCKILLLVRSLIGQLMWSKIR